MTTVHRYVIAPPLNPRTMKREGPYTAFTRMSSHDLRGQEWVWWHMAIDDEFMDMPCDEVEALFLETIRWNARNNDPMDVAVYHYSSANQ